MRFARTLCIWLVVLVPCLVLAQATTANDAARDGQHDWDTMFGSWKMHLRRLAHPLSNSNEWQEFESYDTTRKVWDGRANLDELEAEGPSGHIEGMTLRLYDRDNHQWRIYWANSANPAIDVPMIGSYNSSGRGEFYDQELYHGRGVYVRFTWTNVSDHSGDFEQAFSTDGGKSWEPNWVSTMQPAPAGDPVKVPDTPGQHDFDFEFGKWHAHLRRRLHPLTGSNEWVEYDGTSTVNKVWNGKANLGEFEVDGNKSHIEGLSLRLFDPKSQQWNIYWASANDGILGPTPMVGGFKNGRGEFYDSEMMNGRVVFVRFIFSGITKDSFHLEQAFSGDGGKTWEANWVTSFTREKEQ